MKKLAAFAIVSLMVVSTANAGTFALGLNPGEFGVNPVAPAPAGSSYTLGGVPVNFSVQVDAMTNPFVGDFTGDVTSKVWQDPNTGFLAFEYYFTVDAATSPLRSATIGGNWLSYDVTDVGSDGSGSSTQYGTQGWTNGDPLTMGRLPVSGFGAPAVTFSSNFVPDGTYFLGGDYSAHFWYATNAMQYSINDFDALDGGLSAEAPVFVVPAPAALLLAGVGLPMVGWVRRKFS